MLLRSALFTALTVLIAAAPASAARQPTFGAADGVAVARSGAKVTIRLTGPAAAAGARYAGRRLTVRCLETPPPGLVFAGGDERVGDTEPDGASAEAKVARGADGALTLTAAFDAEDPTPDVCQVARPEIARRPVHRGPFLLSRALRAPLARVPLTAAGTAWIDELARAVAVEDALDRARHVRATAVLTPQEAAAAGLVVLADESASPPAGSVGYWTDGRAKVEVVAVSAAGRRLVEEALGGGMVRDNTAAFSTETVAARDQAVLSFDTEHADPDRTRTPLDDERAPLSLRATVRGPRLTVRFDGRRARATLRRLAGRRVAIACAPAASPSAVVTPEDFVDAFQLVTARVPRRGTVLRATLRAGRGADVCAVLDDGEPVGSAQPTAAGRAFAQDLDALGDVLGVSLIADPRAGAYPSAASLAAERPDALVALSGPDAAPPAPGRAGVWTAGAQALLVTRSRSGHDLVLADEGNGVVRDNTAWTFVVGSMLQAVL